MSGTLDDLLFAEDDSDDVQRQGWSLFFVSSLG